MAVFAGDSDMLSLKIKTNLDSERNIHRHVCATMNRHTQSAFAFILNAN